MSQRYEKCHSVTLIFLFFVLIEVVRRILFLPLESLFHALQHWFQGSLPQRLCFAGNWSLSASTKNLGSKSVTVLRDYKKCLQSQRLNKKASIL